MFMTSRPTPLNFGGSSYRSFNLPRIKAAAALLRSGQPNVNDMRRQNSLLLISRLPEHLLSRIFMLVASTSVGQNDHQVVLSPNRSPGTFASSSTWSWVLLTYVCHSWRATALACPELWRYVDFSHPKWHNITLQRARMQPLEISAVVGRHNIQQLHRTLHLAHRIGSIEIDSSLHHIHILLANLAHPNPSIQSMTVRVNTAGHGVQDTVYDPPSFPLIGPVLPDMKYLELHSAPFYLVSGRFTSLTSLHLHDLTPCERPVLPQFLSALSKYPNLQHLTLNNAFPVIRSDIPFPRSTGSPAPSPRSQSPALSSSPSSTRTHSPSPQPFLPHSPNAEQRLGLSRLETLRLAGNIPEIATFLESVMLPPDVKITCTIISLVDWRQSITRFAHALNFHAHATSGAGRVPRTLIVSGLEEQGFPSVTASMAASGRTVQGVRLRLLTSYVRKEGSPVREKAGRSPSPPKSPPPGNNLWLDLTIGPDCNPDFSADEIVIRSFTTIWNALPLSKVQTLVLHDLDIVTQKTWTQFLKSLTSLRLVDISGHAPSGFVWALLLNANACAQREEREKERKERRQRKALKIVADAQNKQNSSGSEGNSPISEKFPMPPVSPLSPLTQSSRKLFVPHLVDVYVRGVDCSSGGYMMAPDAPVNSHCDLDDSRFLDVLLACLKARAQVTSSIDRPSLQLHPATLSPFALPSSGFPPRRPTSATSTQHSANKLRSLTIANCKYASRKTALELENVVSNFVWDQKGMIKDNTPQAVANPDPNADAARYRRVGKDLDGKVVTRHYYRLKAVLDEL
ncbi:hypothetical protein FA15DRAFT_755403 [Coprinopsis marcescibilis]|uniref:Uncharacterized protein n=1 Tax=Coprinopsis marcescibilis TaxID=230819 RepID=A0A5C3KZT3_COPMA|nr:hypothetical protein FA15DRAFT_755403 [Coprinopsis marcescibilis]